MSTARSLLFRRLHTLLCMFLANRAKMFEFFRNIHMQLETLKYLKSLLLDCIKLSICKLIFSYFLGFAFRDKNQTKLFRQCCSVSLIIGAVNFQITTYKF